MRHGTPLATAGAGLLLAITVAFLGYQLVSVWISLHGAMRHYTVHLAFVLTVTALTLIVPGAHPGDGDAPGREPAWRARLRAGVALSALAVALCALGTFYVNAETLEIMQPFIDTRMLWLGAGLIGAVLVLTGLLWGWPLAGVCFAGVAYFAFGDLLPGGLAPANQPANVVISFLSGIGGPRGVMTYMPLSADMIFLLLVYGGALHGCRVIDMFAQIGSAIGNRLRGGVAYSAVAASSLIGMVSGQAVSNIALSGVMTIPTMRRGGFSRENAGAVEVIASTGSQLLPPIMGLGAFLMAVILGVAYFEIVKAALIPGLLYMAATVIGVAFMIGVSPDVPRHRQPVDWRLIRVVAPSFLASFAVLIVLLALRFSPAMAGFWGLAVLLAGSVLRPADMRPRPGRLVEGLRLGTYTAVCLTLILAAIGLVVQALSSTGAGVALGRTVADLSGGVPILGLMVAMVVSLVIGMGLPTPAAYALIAIVVSPALIDLGFDALTANMFGFYFAIFSALTPPVAVGVLAATRISGGSFLGTALACAKLGGVCFLVPFLFVLEPGILHWNRASATTPLAVAIFLCATVLFAAALTGRFRRPLRVGERIGFALAGPGALIAALALDAVLVGLVAPAGLAVWLSLLARAERRARSRPDGVLETPSHGDHPIRHPQ